MDVGVKKNTTVTSMVMNWWISRGYTVSDWCGLADAGFLACMLLSFTN